MSDLATTVDLDGVEILEAGVRIHGRGSPPEGDLYSKSDLEAMAAASRELAAELFAPAKIGHGGDQPAVGWLENLRVEGSKLVADVKRVPRHFADLVKARAYRTRSAELSRVRSQRTGRTYESVVTGLAWLGGRMPAARTLNDVVALYQDGGVEIVPRRAFETPGATRAAVNDVDELLAAAVADGRIAYAGRAALEGLAEKDASFVREFVDGRPPDRRLAQTNWVAETEAASRALDAEDETHGEESAADKAEREEIARELGIPVEEVL